MMKYASLFCIVIKEYNIMDNSERLALSYANWDSYCAMKQAEVKFEETERKRIESARLYHRRTASRG